MLQKPAKDLHLILRDHPEPPRLLVIPKGRLVRFFILIPSLIVALIAAAVLSFTWGRLKTIDVPLAKVSLEPQSDRINELEQELQGLREGHVALQKKLTETAVSEVDVWLGPVKRPYALQDLTAKKILRLENIQLDSGANKRVLRFHLINDGVILERVTGHVFVFQIDGRGMAPYPAMTEAEWIDGIRYNKGESFAVARLRPVEAPFPPADKDARFLVLVFNREGDLLIRQEISGPLKSGATP